MGYIKNISQGRAANFQTFVTESTNMFSFNSCTRLRQNGCIDRKFEIFMQTYETGSRALRFSPKYCDTSRVSRIRIVVKPPTRRGKWILIQYIVLGSPPPRESGPVLASSGNANFLTIIQDDFDLDNGGQGYECFYVPCKPFSYPQHDQGLDNSGHPWEYGLN